MTRTVLLVVLAISVSRGDPVVGFQDVWMNEVVVLNENSSETSAASFVEVSIYHWVGTSVTVESHGYNGTGFELLEICSLTGKQPSANYTNLDQRIYVCEMSLDTRTNTSLAVVLRRDNGNYLQCLAFGVQRPISFVNPWYLPNIDCPYYPATSDGNSLYLTGWGRQRNHLENHANPWQTGPMTKGVVNTDEGFCPDIVYCAYEITCDPDASYCLRCQNNYYPVNNQRECGLCTEIDNCVTRVCGTATNQICLECNVGYVIDANGACQRNGTFSVTASRTSTPSVTGSTSATPSISKSVLASMSSTASVTATASATMSEALSPASSSQSTSSPSGSETLAAASTATPTRSVSGSRSPVSASLTAISPNVDSSSGIARAAVHTSTTSNTILADRIASIVNVFAWQVVIVKVTREGDIQREARDFSCFYDPLHLVEFRLTGYGGRSGNDGLVEMETLVRNGNALISSSSQYMCVEFITRLDGDSAGIKIVNPNVPTTQSAQASSVVAATASPSAVPSSPPTASSPPADVFGTGSIAGTAVAGAIALSGLLTAVLYLFDALPNCCYCCCPNNCRRRRRNRRKGGDAERPLVVHGDVNIVDGGQSITHINPSPRVAKGRNPRLPRGQTYSEDGDSVGDFSANISLYKCTTSAASAGPIGAANHGTMSTSETDSWDTRDAPSQSVSTEEASYNSRSLTECDYTDETGMTMYGETFSAD